MQIRFWGTRGSLPTAARAGTVRAKLQAALRNASGRHFADDVAIDRFLDEELDFSVSGTYGGASSCVEIDTGQGDFFICDMGSGLREFGLDSLKRLNSGRTAGGYHFFLSHPHWDHIMGFPFFVPAFFPGTKLRFHGGHDIEAVLRRQQDNPSFPVPLSYMPADFGFERLEPNAWADVAGFRVYMKLQNHHGNSYGYRFERDGKTIVYSTDAEHRLENEAEIDAHVEFMRNADVVIFDTMYSLADAISVKADWGHSSNIVAVDMCQRANVRRLVMFHHEPVFDDRMIEQVHRETIRYAELTAAGSALEVLCAYDGMELGI